MSALDLSVRGGERWEPIEPDGTPPSGRMLPSVGLDAERGQVLLYGGVALGSTSDLASDLYTLDISSPGFEQWTSIEIPDPRPPLLGASIIVDEARDRALLVGGATAGASEIEATDTIYTLDLTNLGDGLAASGTLLPLSLFGAATMVDVSRDRALIAWGGSGTVNAPVVSSAIYSLSLESLEVTEVAATDAPEVGGFHGFLAEDAYEPGRVIANTGTAALLGSAVNLYAMDGETTSFTPVEVLGLTSPPALSGAFASADRDGLLMFGGSHQVATDQVWRHGVDGWSAIAAVADAATGRSPGPRYGGGTILSFDTAMWVFGGRTDDGAAEATAWMLQPTSGGAEWAERPVPSTDPVPATSSGASLFDVSCSPEGFGLFRGGNTNDVWLFQCNTAGCTWELLTFASEPPNRDGAATSAVGSEVIMFGGNRLNDLWVLEPCLPVPAWTPITPTGTPPDGRAGHGMVLIPDADPDVTRWLVHGGSNSDTLADAWMLIREAGAYRWEPLVADGDPPSARAMHALVWDESRSRVLIYGGRTVGFMPDRKSDLWELRFPDAR